MRKFTIKEAFTIREKIKQIPYWYHHIELGMDTLGEKIVTSGWAPIDPKAYRLPERLDGKRVLDIGTWDGYWTFEALKRGAKQVVAIDNFSGHTITVKRESNPSFGRDGKVPEPSWEGFELCQEVLGFTQEQCSHVNMDIMDIPAHPELGHFDLIMFFGVLYHLKNPILCLENLSKIGDEIIVESAISDLSGAFNPCGYGDKCVMEVCPNGEYASDETNFTVPTLRCMGAMLHMTNWKGVTCWKLKPTALLSTHRGYAHATIKGTSKPMYSIEY